MDRSVHKPSALFYNINATISFHVVSKPVPMHWSVWHCLSINRYVLIWRLRLKHLHHHPSIWCLLPFPCAQLPSVHFLEDSVFFKKSLHPSALLPWILIETHTWTPTQVMMSQLLRLQKVHPHIPILTIMMIPLIVSLSQPHCHLLQSRQVIVIWQFWASAHLRSRQTQSHNPTAPPRHSQLHIKASTSDLVSSPA